MKTGDNIRLRADGRYEARYIKSRDVNGKIKYGYCYGKTIEEVKEKRNYQLNKRKKNREMNLLILGAGSHGKDVKDIALQTHLFQKVSFLDDVVDNPDIIGKWHDYDKYLNEYPIAIVAVGDNRIRCQWMEKLENFGYIIPSLIHPTAYISNDVHIEKGVVVCARTTVSTGATLKKGCIIESGSTIPRNEEVPQWSDYLIDKVI